MQIRAKEEKVAENSMNTDVGKALSLLAPNYHFSKCFLESRLVDSTVMPDHITLDYRTRHELGIAMGVLLSHGYGSVASGKGEYSLTFPSRTLTLRKKVPVFVTDFDLLDYNWKYQCFIYQGQPLSDEFRAKFLARRCTLTFSSEDASPSEEKRQALLHYIHSNWAIFDQQGQEITFKDMEDPTLALDAARPWKVIEKKKEPELTLEAFYAELAPLVAKYWSVFEAKK